MVYHRLFVRTHPCLLGIPGIFLYLVYLVECMTAILKYLGMAHLCYACTTMIGAIRRVKKRCDYDIAIH